MKEIVRLDTVHCDEFSVEVDPKRGVVVECQFGDLAVKFVLNSGDARQIADSLSNAADELDRLDFEGMGERS